MSASPDPGPSRAEALRDELRAQIITTRRHPGDLMLEKALATEFGVSKTPVREALQMLVVEGWVDLRPRRGYAVRSMGFHDIREVMHLRQALEPLCASGAAAHVDDELVSELEQLLDRQITAPAPPEAVAAAYGFHERIALAGRNRRAHRILKGLWDETTRAHHLLPPLASYIDADTERAAHRQVLDAIVAGDAELAGSTMHAHLKEAEEAMVHAFYR